MNPAPVFAGLNVTDLRRDRLLEDAGTVKLVFSLNAELVVRANEDPRLAAIVNENHTMVDGRLPHLLCRRKWPALDIEKISGSDLIYDVAAGCAARKRKLFLLGGSEEGNRGAVRALREKFEIACEGYSSPPAPFPFPDPVEDEIRRRLETFRPDYLFVGYGMPKQEFWMARHKDGLEALGVRMAVGCGGTFDFVSGLRKRAPKWVQSVGLEGLFRLVVEPRLFRLKRLWMSLRIFKYAR